MSILSILSIDSKHSESKYSKYSNREILVSIGEYFEDFEYWVSILSILSYYWMSIVSILSTGNGACILSTVLKILKTLKTLRLVAHSIDISVQSRNMPTTYRQCFQ